MSHIPSAAMPHAKAHEETDVPVTVKAVALPWAAIAAGGVLAIGGAVTALWLSRRSKPAPRRRAARGAAPTPAKPGRPRKKAAKAAA